MGIGAITHLNDLPSRKKVLTLKYMGYDSDAVADILGITSSQVDYHVSAAIKASVDPQRVDYVRETELLKLEELESSFWPMTKEHQDSEGNAAAPAVDAAKMVLSIMDRRSKMLGVDKAVPQQVNHTHSLVAILAGIARDAESMVIDGTVNG